MTRRLLSLSFKNRSSKGGSKSLKTGDNESTAWLLRLRGQKEGSLPMWKDGLPLQKPQFNKVARIAQTQAKLPVKKIAGHSFRIGAATTVASAGSEDSTIQTLGWWKRSSYLLCIRLEPRRLAGVSATLTKCGTYITTWIPYIYSCIVL